MGGRLALGFISSEKRDIHHVRLLIQKGIGVGWLASRPPFIIVLCLKESVKRAVSQANHFPNIQDHQSLLYV